MAKRRSSKRGRKVKKSLKKSIEKRSKRSLRRRYRSVNSKTLINQIVTSYQETKVNSEEVIGYVTYPFKPEICKKGTKYETWTDVTVNTERGIRCYWRKTEPDDDSYQVAYFYGNGNGIPTVIDNKDGLIVLTELVTDEVEKYNRGTTINYEAIDQQSDNDTRGDTIYVRLKRGQVVGIPETDIMKHDKERRTMKVKYTAVDKSSTSFIRDLLHAGILG